MCDVNRGARLRAGMLGSLLLPGLAMAQTAPAPLEPGNAQRIDGYYARRLEPATASGTPPVVESRLPETPSTTAGVGGTMTLSRLHVGPSSLLPEAWLHAFAERQVGRTVSVRDLHALVDEINAEYAVRGLSTAQAVLPAQEIEDGVVRIDLVEGRLGQLEVQSLQPVPDAFLRRRVRLEEGAVVRTDWLRDDLVWINRTSDLQVRALLRPGAAVGESDVVLVTEAPAPRALSVFADNAGVDSTGRERIGVQGQFWGLAGRSDALMGSLAWSDGGLEGRIGYSGLLGRRNGRLGLNLTRNQISLVDGAYRDLDITGESTSYSLDYVQPWIASQAWMVSTQLGVGRSNSISEIMGVQVAEVDSTVLNAGVLASYRGDGFEWNLQQTVSRQTTDEETAAGDSFTTALGRTDWTQRIGQSAWLYRVVLGWQFSGSERLPAGNLFQIGGIGSVRGYVRGALSGVQGYYGSAELHRGFAGRHDGYVFVDHGAVEDESGKRSSIGSVGVGMNGQLGQRYAYSVDVGHALDEVVSYQDSIRIDFRLSARW